MKGLYLLLDIGTFFFPMILSFDRRVHYISKWRTVFIATLIISIPFLVWDVLFTHQGVWGFNPTYLVGIELFKLPLEEYLFFFVVPFACTFIYECCKHYFRAFSFKWLNTSLIVLIPLYSLALCFLDHLGRYTLSVFISSGIVLIFWGMNLKRFPMIGIAFVLSLIPFLGVNGMLTGSTLEAPIVWYNELHKVQERIGTIPLEDVLYAFTLIVSVILVHEFLQQKKISKGP